MRVDTQRKLFAGVRIDGRMREQLDKLLTQPVELPKPKQAPVEIPPEAKKPTAQKRPSIAYKPGEKVASIG